jgi:hypothetical protein
MCIRLLINEGAKHIGFKIEDLKKLLLHKVKIAGVDVK